MPLKRRSPRRRRVMRRRGAGFFDALKSAHDFIKKNKIISSVSGALSGVPGIGGIASAINKGSLALGYGRHRRVGRPRRTTIRRRRVGGSLRSILSKVHGFVKSNQLVSKGLNHFNHPKLASLAHSAGYGKRRRTVRRRTIRHRGSGMDVRGMF